jgi:YebC/PmpR family DNA-binding regulatory protein
MAGHSQFKNIMHRKGIQDAKKAKIFTKLIRELTVAARQGADPAANNRLRSAIIAARTANMPKDTMERAIKRGAGGEELTQYEEVRYEGYGPSGIAFIVEALTDNRNRTAPEIRAAFTKSGGGLGESNSVSYLFDHLGIILYPFSIDSQDNFFEKALEAGALGIEFYPDYYEVTVILEGFVKVRDQLMQHYKDPLEAVIAWRAQTPIAVEDPENAKSILKLIHTLEDNDDVQQVFTNADIPLSLMESFS